MLGLYCCVQPFSSCGEQGLFFVHGLLIAVASGCIAQALGAWASVVVVHRLGSCGTWASLLLGIRYLPRSRIEPVTPALADGFSTTRSPGKPEDSSYKWSVQQGFIFFLVWYIYFL